MSFGPSTRCGRGPDDLEYRIAQSQDKHRNVSHHGAVSDEEPRPEEQTAPLAAQQPPPPPEEQTTPLASERPPLPPDQPPAAAGQSQRWRDRAWSLRAVIAVGLASVILGGLAGAAIATVGNHQDQQRGPGFGRFQGGPGMPPGQRGFGQGPRRFHDPNGSGQRQWGQQQQPNGPNGRLQPFGPGGQGGRGTNPTPTPPTPSATS